MNKNQDNLGAVVVTPAAQNSMQEQGVEADTLLRQHLDISWVGPLDSMPQTNGFFLSRLMSAQKIPLGELWVITEFDSRTTTISLPDELFF